LELHTWLDCQLRDGRYDCWEAACQAVQDLFAGLAADYEHMGIGMHASERRGLAVFCVISWPALQVLRQERFGLPLIDTHITLGFAGHDVHGVAKGLSTLVDDETLQRVSEAYLSGLPFEQQGHVHQGGLPLLPTLDKESPQLAQLFDSNQNQHHQASRAISKILARTACGQQLRSSFGGDKKKWTFPLHTHHALQAIAQHLAPEERCHVAQLWETVCSCRSRELAIIESMMVENGDGLLEFSCLERPLQSVGVGSGKNSLQVSLIGPFASCSSKRFATEAVATEEHRMLQRVEYQRHLMWLETAHDFAIFARSEEFSKHT
jgi:hypothetical protein